MPDGEAGSSVPDQPRPRPAGRGAGPWLVVAGLLVVSAAALAVLGGEDGAGRRTNRHAEAALVTTGDLALAYGGSSTEYRRVPPPVDVDEAERYARRLPFDAIPLPSQRVLVTWRGPGGIEISQAVLYFDDPEEAERLNSLAGTLLQTGLGLTASEASLDGTRARRWTTNGFEGVSFREGPYLVLVGASAPGPPPPDALGAVAVERAEAALAALEEERATALAAPIGAGTATR